jgi:hypothetical protein
MLNRLLSERLNEELDSIEVPKASTERIDALAKMIRIPKFTAGQLLDGSVNSNDDQMLEKLAQELEVSIDWLVGKSDSKS